MKFSLHGKCSPLISEIRPSSKQSARLRLTQIGLSNRNRLHDIPADLALAPVVEIRGVRVGVPGQVLYVLARHILLQRVGNVRNSRRI